jgi:bifunctional non-homologous end joining protein LigD
MSLNEYRRKRDFTRTSEPLVSKSGQAGRRFVVQKHHAKRLHYDFRLELDSTLKSWAVPKGVPYKHGEKRLAMQVEDHPLSYVDFEGTIPKGQYGGGTVMLWDRGTFEPLTESPVKDLGKGKLHFILHGEKLSGEWYLVRLREEKTWLLIRGGKSMKPIAKKAADTSVASGESMKKLAKGDRVWSSKPATRKSVLSTPIPDFVEPMKAKLVADAPGGGGWLYEIKFDGFRALALRGSDEARLLSRNNKDLGAKFPEVLESVSALKVKDAIIDGEIVALDEQGRSSFQLLQQFEMGREKPPLYYYVFDILRLNGKDVRNRPLVERKSMLESILPERNSIIRYSAALGENANSLLQQARKLGLEGLIGKKKDSTYEVGVRSGKWIKLKLLREQEFVIGGYTDPEGSRKFFGSLLTGVYQDKELIYCGKVGTGFSNSLLRNLHARMEKIASSDCPFADLPQRRGSKWEQPIAAPQMKRCHWVQPKMVCQLKFGEWTQDNHLRQPVYLGLREDKDATEVIRERPSA